MPDPGDRDLALRARSGPRPTPSAPGSSPPGWRRGEAAAFYELALAGQTGDDPRWTTLMALGRARMEAGEVARASDAFREALELRPAASLFAKCTLSAAEGLRVIESVDALVDASVTVSGYPASFNTGIALGGYNVLEN